MREPGKGPQREVILEGWQWVLEPESAREPAASVTTPGTNGNDRSRSLGSQTRGSLAEGLILLQGEPRERECLLNDGCLPRTAMRLGQRGEMLFFLSEYLLGLSVVHSSLRNPLALPVLPRIACILLPVSFSQFGSGIALDFYN